MQVGDLLQDLSVTDCTVTGSGVARVDGRVVFIGGALPGSVVSARVTGMRKGTVQAVQYEVREPSPFFTPPWCPHHEECGACLWQHFSLEGARQWKARHVRETLARIGKIHDITVLPALASPLEKAFRNKMSFAFGPKNDADNGPKKRADAGEPLGLEIGLRRRGGKGVVPVTHCGLQGGMTMRILEQVRAMAEESGLVAWEDRGRRGYLRFLVVRVPSYRPQGAGQCLVECITGPAHEARASGKTTLTNREAVHRMGLALVDAFGLTGFVHSERRDAADVAQGERLVWSEGESAVVERFGKTLLTVPYDAFIQTNTEAASLLYERIAEEAGLTGEQQVWDLYSGVGAIALSIADKAKEVHGFETGPSAVKAARANSRALGMSHCFFHEGAVTPDSFSSLPSPDVIIADPPRSGIESHIIDALGATHSKKFIYISCDVATQARDIARLSNIWMPVMSIPVDMFPYTPHVENIVVLNRIPE